MWQLVAWGKSLGGAVAVPRLPGIDGLLKHAARAAFWDLPEAAVKQFCKEMGVEPGTSFFDTLLSLVMAVLGIREAEDMEIIKVMHFEAELAFRGTATVGCWHGAVFQAG